MFLLCQSGYAQQDIVLNFPVARAVCGSNGVWKSFLDKATNMEMLAQASPMMTIRRNNDLLPCVRMSLKDRQLDVWFGKEERPFSFDISYYADFIIMRLKSGDLANITELNICQLILKREVVLAPVVAGIYNEIIGVFLQALSYRGNTKLTATDSTVHLTCTFVDRYGINDAAYALMVVRRSDLPSAFEKVEVAGGLPHITLSGIWAKESPDVHRSYIFITDLAQNNVEKLIEYARRARFNYILIHQNVWSASNGTFAVNTRNFPDGIVGLKKVIEKLHDAGFQVGLHLLCAGIGKNDPLVTPVPSNGLYSDVSIDMLDDIDERNNFIATANPPDKFPSREEGYRGHGLTIRIEDEIVAYTGLKLNPPYGFIGCTRGAFGSRAASHPRGSTIKHLYQSYGLFLIDADRSLLEQVSSNAARIWNECGCDGIYFDGAEALQGDFWYYNPKITLAYTDKLGKKNVLIQSSSVTQYSWHMNLRRASADGFRNIKKNLDERIGTFHSWFETNFMPLDIGWYAINNYTQPDDIEYVCGKAIGFDASISIETGISQISAHPHGTEILDIIRKYEDVKLADKISVPVKEELRKPGTEYRMVVNEGKSSFIPVRYSDWTTAARGTYKESIVVKNEKSTGAQLELQILATSIVTPGRSYTIDGKPILSFDDLTITALDRNTHGEKPDIDMSISPSNRVVFKPSVKTGNGVAWGTFSTLFDERLDLSGAIGLGLWVFGDGNGEWFSLRLSDEKGAKIFSSKIDYKGWKYQEIMSTGPKVDLAHIVGLEISLGEMPPDVKCSISLEGIRAISEKTVMQGLRINIGSETLYIREEIFPGVEISAMNGKVWWYAPYGKSQKILIKEYEIPEINNEPVTVSIEPLEGEEAIFEILMRTAELWPKESMQ